MAFFSVFSRAVSREEISEYLGGQTSFNEAGLWEKDGFLALKEEDFSRLEEFYEKSDEYMKKAKKYLRFLRFVPFVRGVAVVNTVAFRCAEEKSDIDVFIITKRGQIWTARVFTTILLHVLGVRRHGDKIAGRFCLSFFADEDNLDLSKIKLNRDPFLAFWTASIVPIFGDFEDFAEKNRAWVKEEMGIALKFEKSIYESGKTLFGSFLELVMGTWFEKLVRKVFLKRTLEKAEKLQDRSGTVISEGMLKFHDMDRRAEIAEKFELVMES